MQTYEIPGLATVTIDTLDDSEPTVRIVLDPAYKGDLNDLEQANSLDPGVYLEADTTSAINNPALAKFMEVLSHWDYDQDGAFDGDNLADIIEAALWRSTDKPQEFHRPKAGWFTGTLMKLMPPAPERHIIFGFGELKHRRRWLHYVATLPVLAMVFGLVQLQIHFFPFMRFSVVSGALTFLEWLGIPAWAAIILFVAGAVLISRLARRSQQADPSALSPHTYGLFNKMAVYEEQCFREGAENWSWGQRITSCLVFGVIHMTNLIYPLATILPLAVGGAIFMVAYLINYRRTKFRRSAVLAAAMVHRVYNFWALVAFVIAIAISLGWLAVGLFGSIAIMLWLRSWRNYHQIVDKYMAAIFIERHLANRRKVSLSE